MNVANWTLSETNSDGVPRDGDAITSADENTFNRGSSFCEESQIGKKTDQQQEIFNSKARQKILEKQLEE